MITSTVSVMQIRPTNPLLLPTAVPRLPDVLRLQYPVTGLPINGEAETYGTDTTYYLYDTGADLPTAATQPAVR